MNGTVISFFEKTKKTGGTYYNVVVKEGEAQNTYLCTDPATMAAIKDGVNKELSFYTFKSKDGTATFMSLPKESGASGGAKSYSGGFKKTDPARNESFACAYAKDLVVSLINNGQIGDADTTTADLITQSTQALEVYYAYFLDKLNASK